MSKGIGVMINELTGNYGSVNLLVQSVGKRLKSLELNDNKLQFKFDDGTEFYVIDDGQSCCENRYLTTEDELNIHENAEFLNMEIASLDDIKSDYEDHERECWKVSTSAGTSSIIAHNEHNGYYGGFSIRVIQN